MDTIVGGALKIDNYKILLVEDHPVNRSIIKKHLSDQYQVVEVENGKIALEILQVEAQQIAAIILDLNMPVMDGISFLHIFSQKKEYSNIPIIVTTIAEEESQEIECLALGAWDFIRKPINGQLLKLRLANVLARSRSVQLAKSVYLAEHDTLTGLYNRNGFLSISYERISKCKNPTSLVLLHMDIKKFRLVNALLGTETGNQLLCFIAEHLSSYFKAIPEAVCGRMEADSFGILAPLTEPQILSFVHQMQELVKTYKPNYYLELTFGAYKVDNPLLSIEVMYDHAEEAAAFVKDMYQSPVCFYRPEMSKAEILEQEIMGNAQEALESGQFEVYLQPKYDLVRHQIYGAEALARWSHPKYGMISPGAFIPIFEKNGFVAKLDFYIWEETCRLLKKWKDSGLNPDPVSVNISRINLYNPRLVTIIKALVKKYNLSPSLLNLEITESAYMDNPEQMKRIVRMLQNAGFLIMMDDFGSGYSSLNTLKDISMDVLKVDMRFLPTDQSNMRSEKILTAVIRMAGWLNMEVIVEGVETKAQLDFLEGVGCGYVQGFYFAKPMPSDEYEKILNDKKQYFVTVDGFEKNTPIDSLMWTSSSEVTALLDGIMNPVAIFEYGYGICDPIRVNAEFLKMFGTVKENLKKQVNLTLCEHDALCVRDAFRKAAKEKTDTQVEYNDQNSSGETIRVRLQLRCVQVKGKRVYLLALFTCLGIIGPSPPG